MTRRASPKAYNLIKGFESLRLLSYQDPGGVWTVGWGHTNGVGPNEEITKDRAEELIHEDVMMTIATIYEFVPDTLLIALPQASYDALVSFVFNVGRQAFVNPDKSRTDFLQALTGPDLTQVPIQMRRWVYGRNRRGQLTELAGLIARRGKESALFQAGLEYANALSTTSEDVVHIEQGRHPEPPPANKPTDHRGGGAIVVGVGVGTAGALATLDSPMLIGMVVATLVLLAVIALRA